jgi:hypothetical protein
MAEFREIQGRMSGPDEFIAAVQSYRPRPTDVVIAPFGKCGTTWLQQIFHCLRTRGDTDFDDISSVVPWIETAHITGLDLEAPQPAEPRGFKSHLSYDLIPKGARYIVAFRDPKDALVSMFRFMEGWFIEPGTVTIDEYAQPWLAGEGRYGDYWSHLISWWEQRDNPDVLLLSYEGMTKDAEASIRRVAAFCGLALDDELLALTLDHSSLAYMLEHKDKFDDLLMREAAEQRCNLPAGGDSSKVRKGGVGGHRDELPPEVAAGLDANWAARIEPRLGFADYAAFEAALR